MLLDNEQEVEKFLLAAVKDVSKSIIELKDAKLISAQLREVFSIAVSEQDLNEELQIEKKNMSNIKQRFNEFFTSKALLLKQD